MVRLTNWFGPLMLLWPLMLSAQTQPSLAGILERLDRLERENRALTAEVRALRAKIEVSAGSQAPADGQTVPDAIPPDTPASPGTTLEEKVEIQGQRIDELAQTKVEAAQKFPIRITGMALFNAFENSRQSAGAQYPTVASAPGMSGAGASVRQTILGLEYRGPQTLWGGTVQGNVYMDFAAGGNVLDLRMRTASVEIDWKNRSIMAGVEKPIFNPRDPSSLAQLAVSPLTGTGNLWLWLPQVRFEQDINFASGTGLRAQLGVVQTREAAPYAGSTYTGTLTPARPALEGRFEFFHRLDEDRRIEIAPGFHSSVTHIAGMSVPSSIFSVDWFLNPWRRVELSGAFYTGQNVAPLGEGYAQGFGIQYGGYIRAVESRGGWGQLTIHTLPRLDFHLFTGQQDDNNHDLDTGLIAKNLLFGANLYYHLAPNVILAWETTQLRTTYLGQGMRINNHYDLALAYLF